MKCVLAGEGVGIRLGLTLFEVCVGIREFVGTVCCGSAVGEVGKS